MRRSSVSLTVFAGLLAASGCSNSGPKADIVDTVAAGGVLTHDGKPLEYYQVMVIPDGKRPAAGTTDDQGKFTLGTNKPGDGAAAGTHKVTISFVGPPNQMTPDMDGYKPPKPSVKLAAKYGNEAATDLKVEIPAGGSGDLKIEVP